MMADQDLINEAILNAFKDVMVPPGIGIDVPK